MDVTKIFLDFSGIMDLELNQYAAVHLRGNKIIKSNSLKGFIFA